MERKLFVGNLSPETTELTLRQLFSQVGEVVTVTLSQDAATGLPRGFVEMATEAQAQAAMRVFAGYRLGERQLFLGEYRKRGEPSPQQA